VENLPPAIGAKAVGFFWKSYQCLFAFILSVLAKIEKLQRGR
jgi:hypothetical protein